MVCRACSMMGEQITVLLMFSKDLKFPNAHLIVATLFLICADVSHG